jgi:hypothetical protein
MTSLCITYPEHDYLRLVFPLRTGALAGETMQRSREYNPDLTQGRYSNEEFESFVKRVEQAFSKLRTFQIIIFIFALGLIAFNFYLASRPSDTMLYIQTGLTFVLLLLIVALLSMYGQVSKSLTTVIDEENKLAMSRGMQWQLEVGALKRPHILYLFLRAGNANNYIPPPV